MGLEGVGVCVRIGSSTPPVEASVSDRVGQQHLCGSAYGGVDGERGGQMDPALVLDAPVPRLNNESREAAAPLPMAASARR